MALTVIEEGRACEAVATNRQGGRRVKAAAQQHDGAFHFASGYWARTVNAILPRAEIQR
jgi:hypothetical protein